MNNITKSKRITDLIEKYQDRKYTIMKLVHPCDNPIIETLRDIIFDLEELKKLGNKY